MDIGFHSRRIESDSHCGNLFRPGDARHCIVDTFSSHRADTFERPIVKLMVRLHLLPRTGEVLKEFPFRDPHLGITIRRALRYPHYQYLRPQGSRDEKSFQTPSEISVDPIENFRGFIEDLANTLVISMILPYFLRRLYTTCKRQCPLAFTTQPFFPFGMVSWEGKDAFFSFKAGPPPRMKLPCYNRN